MLILDVVKRTDVELNQMMASHYSKPKGFVGRNICYKIKWDGITYGAIVGGSATLHLPGRDEYFNTPSLNNICNNVFFHCYKVNGKYPLRNFTTYVVKKWLDRIKLDWKEKYTDTLAGVETLVELPRSGELYKRAGFVIVGTTKGYTCKRIAGNGTDSWGGKRIWNTDKTNLKPKLVLCIKY